MPPPPPAPNTLETMLLSDEAWPEASTLLDQALALEGDERRAWLEALYQIDPVHSNLIAQILSQESSINSGDFLQRPPAFHSILANDLAKGAPTAAIIEAPDHIGPYKLIRELGRGGMGVVWLAERADGTLNRQVAIKTLLNVAHRSDLTERFLRERDILARLEHPNIARLYDAGVSAQGEPYLVLQFVEGVPINDYCRAHRLTTRNRVALFAKVLAAVQYAHNLHIIHRDLKPSNILVTAGGELMLLDFGIAKMLAPDTGSAIESELTFFSGKALTLEYASPEQIRGEPLTVAADIYSLGVVLYELLTDTRPFKSDRPSRAALEEAILNDDAVVPSAAIIGGGVREAAINRRTDAPTLRTALRGDIDAIVMTAIAKLPKRRYASVARLMDDLAAWLNGLPVQARPESRRSRAIRFVARYKLLAGASAAVLLALAGGTAVSLWQAGIATENQRLAQSESARAQAATEQARIDARRAQEQAALAQAEAARANRLAQSEARSSQEARRAEADAGRQAARAQVQQQVAQNEAEKAKATQEFLQNLLKRNTTKQGEPLKAQKTTVRELLDEGATQVLADNKLNAETRMSLLETLRDLHLQLGLDARAEDISRKMLDIARAADGGNTKRLLDALLTHIRTMRHTADSAEKGRLLIEAEKIVANSNGIADLQHANFHLANSLFLRTRNLQKSEQEGLRALALFRTAGNSTNDHANAASNMSVIATMRDRLEESIAYLDENLGVLGKLPNAEARRSQPLIYRAHSLAQLYRDREAENNFREGIDIASRLLGENQIDTFQARLRFSIFLGTRGRNGEKQRLLDEMLPRAIGTLGENETFHLPMIRLEAAKAHRAVGNLEQAEDHIDRAIATSEKSEVNTLFRAHTLTEKARLRTLAGDTDAARQLLAQAASIGRAAMGRVNNETQIAQINLAIVQRDMETAKSLSRQLDEQLKGASPSWRQAKLLLDGELLIEEKRYAEARALLQPLLGTDERTAIPAASTAAITKAQYLLGYASCESAADIEGGVTLLERARLGMRATEAERHPEAIRHHRAMASCLRKLNRAVEAAQSEKAALAVAGQHKALAAYFTNAALIP